MRDLGSRDLCAVDVSDDPPTNLYQIPPVSSLFRGRADAVRQSGIQG
jgi:hypothetical protein